MNSKVAFIHGRPGPHPMHRAFANSIGADSYVVDPYLRWHDIPSSRARRYLSWLISTFYFPGRNKYVTFMTEGTQFPPVFMKWFHLLNREQKVVALLDSEMLYFLREGRYPNATARGLKTMLKQYDALICVGQMETQLAREILRDACPPIFTVFNGIPQERVGSLLQVKPALNKPRIIFIGQGGRGSRIWCKGIDLLLCSFASAIRRMPELELTIVGHWDEDVINNLLEQSKLVGYANVSFVGASRDLPRYLASSALYLHCGRGDAWGVSVLEAMCAGVVPIVSEWTGTREVVAGVHDQLVAPLNADSIAERILWYFELPVETRQSLSVHSRKMATNYTEELALEHFQTSFRKMLNEL